MPYRGRDGRWGRPNADRRLGIVFELLLQLVEFDCQHAFYEVRGQSSEVRGTMGGFMSPTLAILLCSIAELIMGPRPEGAVGG